jgi:hypothetical protein
LEHKFKIQTFSNEGKLVGWLRELSIEIRNVSTDQRLHEFPHGDDFLYLDPLAKVSPCSPNCTRFATIFHGANVSTIKL